MSSISHSPPTSCMVTRTGVRRRGARLLLVGRRLVTKKSSTSTRSSPERTMPEAITSVFWTVPVSGAFSLTTSKRGRTPCGSPTSSRLGRLVVVQGLVVVGQDRHDRPLGGALGLPGGLLDGAVRGLGPEVRRAAMTTHGQHPRRRSAARSAPPSARRRSWSPPVGIRHGSLRPRRARSPARSRAPGLARRPPGSSASYAARFSGSSSTSAAWLNIRNRRSVGSRSAISAFQAARISASDAVRSTSSRS